MARMPKAIPMPMVEELRDVRVNMAVGGRASNDTVGEVSVYIGETRGVDKLGREW